MALSTATELKTEISAWLHRSDLTTKYDDWILLTESMLKREPSKPSSPNIGGVRANISRATGTLTAGTATLALPADFQEMYKLRLTGNTNSDLEPVSHSVLSAKTSTGSGQPCFFAISDVIEFNVAPSSAYAYELSYWPSVLPLAANATNWVLDNYPDCYLWGCLYHASRYTRNQAESMDFLMQYKSAAWTASETYRQGRWSQGSMAIRPLYSTP